MYSSQLNTPQAAALPRPATAASNAVGTSSLAGRLGPIRVTLLIDRLNYGGAERQFVELAKALHQQGHRVLAMVFYEGGALEAGLRASGVSVLTLGKRSRWDIVGFLTRMIRALDVEKTQVLLAYSGVPNLVGLLAKLALPGTCIVWGVRASNMELRRYGLFPWVVGRMAAFLSRRADLIIANSHAGRDYVIGQGYPASSTVVIPNGIDTDRFFPSAEVRARVRRAWGVGPDERVVGIVGRLDPMKGHDTFLKAAARLKATIASARFICVGDGAADYKTALQAQASTLGLGDGLTWLPADSHVSDVYNGLDVLCSASVFGEGFPNVVGEAMACGVPCVVTDVGDSGLILNQPSFTVRTGDADALAAALASILAMPPHEREQLVMAGRNRIVSAFSIPRLVWSTERAIASVLRGSAR
jgi:glycosyltransferase involved in cell wall biosynthesis